MIKKDLIILDIDLKSKEEVFDMVSKKAKSFEYINSKSKFIEALFDRENELSTSIGFGVGIPHCRSESVLKPFVSFVRIKKSILWDDSNEMVNLVFLIAIPKANENNLHLKVLSAISRKLMHEEFREKLSEINDENELIEVLNQINKTVEIGESE